MRISNTLAEALNAQMNEEFYSGYLYLSISAYCSHQSLHGMAAWFRRQAEEEQEHGMKIYDYILSRGGRIALAALHSVPDTYDSVIAMFEKALLHEEAMTANIYSLVDMAMGEKDHAVQVFLNWFVQEQVEEEASAAANLEKVRMMIDADGQISRRDLYWIDHEMTKQVQQ